MKADYWSRLCNLANVLSEWLMYYRNHFWRKCTRGCQNHIQSLRICAAGISYSFLLKVHRALADDKSGFLCLPFFCLAIIPPVFQNEFKYPTYRMIWTRWGSFTWRTCRFQNRRPKYSLCVLFRTCWVFNYNGHSPPLPPPLFFLLLLLFVSVFRAAFCRQFWLAKFRNSVRPPLWLKPEDGNNCLITHDQRHKDNSLRGHSRFLVHR